MFDFFLECSCISDNIQKIKIQNWQANPWYEQWGWVVSILVGISALGISIYQLMRSSKEYIRSVRPFVSASNFAVPSNKQGEIINKPDHVAFQLTNAPARIISLSVKVLIEDKEIYTGLEDNSVKFLGTQWTYIHNNQEFSDVLKKSIEIQSKLRRNIKIEYSALDNKRQYFFVLEQELINGNWKDLRSDAN